jgi:hypothetical protein
MRVGKRLFGYFRSGQVKMAGPHSLYEFIRESPVRGLYLQIQYGMRADERTRAAFLLITSDNSGIAETCRGLHGPANPAYLSCILCSALPSVAPYCVRGGIRVVSIET